MIHLPIMLLITYIEGLENFRSIHSITIQSAAVATHALVIFPFLALICLFETKINRWNMLSKSKEQTGYQLLNQKRTRHLGVDPIRPDKSFMTENEGIIATQRQKLSQKRENQD